MSEWCEQQKDSPRVLRWIQKNPPPKTWKGSPFEWAYTEHAAGELKPCPFCGSHNVIVAEYQNFVSIASRTSHFGYCHDCRSRGPYEPGLEYSKAANSWNVRKSD
jgi:hypothetical protein